MGPSAHLWGPQSRRSRTFRYLLHIISNSLAQTQEICATVRTHFISCFGFSLQFFSRWWGRDRINPSQRVIDTLYGNIQINTAYINIVRHHRIASSRLSRLADRRHPQADLRYIIAQKSIMRPLGRSLDCISSRPSQLEALFSSIRHPNILHLCRTCLDLLPYTHTLSFLSAFSRRL